MEITDTYILQAFWPKSMCLLNRNKRLITEEVIQYLTNRFTKSESIYETLVCLKYNIDRDNLKCPICGKGDLKFTGCKERGWFTKCCSKECTMQYRNTNSEKTCLEKYGAKNPRQNKEKNKEIIETMKRNSLRKYGVEYPSQSKIVKDKIKQTSLERYGVEHPFQAVEVKNKIKRTCLERYGVENPFKSDIVKQHHSETLYNKYGVTNSFNIPELVENRKIHKDEIQHKRDETKRKNKTFGTSIPEQKCYNKLISLLGKDNVIRQYKDDRYPFNCDFYLPKYDIFIECNFFWTHQGHFFNPCDENDLKILNNLREKAKTHTFYIGAIKTWTEGDLLKLKTATDNNLKYYVFWKESEFSEWISTCKLFEN